MRRNCSWRKDVSIILFGEKKMNKKIKKLIVVISFLVLIVSFNVVYASEGADPQNGTSMNNSEEEKNSLFSFYLAERPRIHIRENIMYIIVDSMGMRLNME